MHYTFNPSFATNYGLNEKNPTQPQSNVQFHHFSLNR